MLNKKTCITCCQRNEKIWDEELWNEGYIECPVDEIELTFQNQTVTKNNPYYNLFKAIYTNNATNKINDKCKYQKY